MTAGGAAARLHQQGNLSSAAHGKALHHLYHEIPAREPAIRREIRKLLRPNLAEELYPKTTDAEMQRTCGRVRGSLRQRHRHRVQPVWRHRNQGRWDLLLCMRLLRARKAEHGAERQKERVWLLIVKEISRTNVPDKPQRFTRRRPGNRFEIKKTQRPWKAVCFASIADSIG